MLRIATAFSFLLISFQAAAQDTIRLEREAIQYITAMYTGNLPEMQKRTDPVFSKSAAYKDFSDKTLKEVQEMASSGERFLGVKIAGISALTSKNYKYAQEVNYVARIETPGGHATVSNYLSTMSRDGKLWYFSESGRPRGMQIFSNTSIHTKDMISYNRSFKGLLRRYALDYKEPVGLTPIDSVIAVVYGTVETLHSNLRRGFKVSDELFIGISFNGPIDTTINMKGFPGPDGLPYDHNKNYIPSFNVKYDVFPASYTQQVYNADVSGTYDFLPSKRVHILSTKEKCKVIFIHKDNVVDIEIMFFYLPGSEPLLDKYIKLTKNMLRFK